MAELKTKQTEQNVDEYINAIADDKLGKHKAGKSCLYVKRLADIDLVVLAELVTLSVQEVHRRYN